MKAARAPRRLRRRPAPIGDLPIGGTARARVPGVVVARHEPAPIRRVRQHDRDPLAHRPGAVCDRGIDRDDAFEAFEDRHRVAEIIELRPEPPLLLVPIGERQQPGDPLRRLRRDRRRRFSRAHSPAARSPGGGCRPPARAACGNGATGSASCRGAAPSPGHSWRSAHSAGSLSAAAPSPYLTPT